MLNAWSNGNSPSNRRRGSKPLAIFFYFIFEGGMWMSEYLVKILIEDGKIACCSQLCLETCPNYNKCEPVSIIIKEETK